MKTLDIIFILAIIAFGIFLSVYAYNWMEKERHDQYCSNWNTSIETQKEVLSHKLFPDTTSLNLEIQQWNKECSF